MIRIFMTFKRASLYVLRAQSYHYVPRYIINPLLTPCGTLGIMRRGYNGLSYLSFLTLQEGVSHTA